MGKITRTLYQVNHQRTPKCCSVPSRFCCSRSRQRYPSHRTNSKLAKMIRTERWLCSEYNWKGECVAMTVPLEYNSCTSLKDPWAYNVSSLAPVPGTVCWLHNSNNCSDICRSPSGCSKIVQFPGYANLSTYGYPPWTDRIGSFTCSPDGKTFFE